MTENGERITIVLDKKIAKTLRLIQSKRIAKEQKSVSFSNVINQTLEKGLK